MKKKNNYLFIIPLICIILLGYMLYLQPKASYTLDDEMISVDEMNFPDQNLRNYVMGYVKDPNKCEVGKNLLASVKKIDVSNMEIQNMKGLEYFTGLETLICKNNNMKSLDISANQKLLELNCSGNDLTGLDLSKAHSLRNLDCSENNLTVLDVKDVTSLKELRCQKNAIKALDFSNNPNLSIISCGENRLSFLDLENYANETYVLPKTVYCSGNYFSNGKDFFCIEEYPGFDMERASKWTNASVKGNTVKAVDSDKPVTYSYMIGAGKHAAFSFIPTKKEQIAKSEENETESEKIKVENEKSKTEKKVKVSKGNNVSQVSGNSAKKTTQVPARPKIGLKKHERELRITWKKQPNIDKITIYRKEGKGKYKKYKTIDGKYTSFKIPADRCKKNIDYSFKIRTYRTLNKKKIWSRFSNVVRYSGKKIRGRIPTI